MLLGCETTCVLGRTGTASGAGGQGASKRRSSGCVMRRLGKESGMWGVWALGQIEKAWAGVVGVSEVGEAVADLGRRRVVQS